MGDLQKTDSALDPEVEALRRLYDKQSGPRWFGVRTIFHWKLAEQYEERITMWRADSLGEAIKLAEREANEYENLAQANHLQHVGIAHAYDTQGDFDGGVSGFEIFSLLRKSKKSPEAYLTKYFPSSRESQPEI